EGPCTVVAGREDRLDLGHPRGMFAAEALLQFRGVDESRLWRGEADPRHRLAEKLAVLSLVDGVGGSADHLDAEAVEHTHAPERQRAVQRRLAAHGRQEDELLPGALS